MSADIEHQEEDVEMESGDEREFLMNFYNFHHFANFSGRTSE